MADVPKPVIITIVSLLYLQVFFMLIACTKQEPRFSVAYAWPWYIYNKLQCRNQSIPNVDIKAHPMEKVVTLAAWPLQSYSAVIICVCLSPFLYLFVFILEEMFFGRMCSFYMMKVFFLLFLFFFQIIIVFSTAVLLQAFYVGWLGNK